MLYYADTMQAKAMKLMASKLAVAGLIEGSFSEEGLAAMSDVRVDNLQTMGLNKFSLMTALKSEDEAKTQQ